MSNTYRLTVEVALPPSMDESPLMVLTSLVVDALHQADVPVLSLHIEEADRG